MAASVSPTRGVSFSPDMEEMVKTQIYNPEDLVIFVAPLSTSDAKSASEEFKLRSILKISDSPSPNDHEMLELIKKVESVVEMPVQRNSGAKTRNSVESFQAPAKATFKPTLTTLSAFCEEEEEEV
jgi:hypothetical protein